MTTIRSRHFSISIHTLREEGDLGCRLGQRQDWISIHALREEGDDLQELEAGLISDFYPRPPRGGRRRPLTAARSVLLFLSTPSARRATSANVLKEQVFIFLSTPSARRATSRTRGFLLQFSISIHALREEGDRSLPQPTPASAYFYPRPPRGGRPPHTARNLMGYRISIHALREEGDMTSISSTGSSPNFYPRPPRGGRRDPEAAAYYAKKFLSTPSARRATCFWTSSTTSSKFLSTPSARRATHGHFPRPPRGGRQQQQTEQQKSKEFLSTPSARRATSVQHSLNRIMRDFYPRPPRGGRPSTL